MKLWKSFVVALLTGAVLGLTGCDVGPSAPGEKSGDARPAEVMDFTLPDLEGRPIHLADFRGKIVVIDFWATWCPPCVLEIPELNAFQDEHRGQDVEVLAIAIDVDEPEELRAWSAERGIAYPVAIGDMETARRYGAEQFPLHVLVSREGRIVERLTPGYHDREELAALLARHRQ